MKRIELSRGIWLNTLSNYCATITSSLPNATPNWRIAYFGFSKWTDATSFVAYIKRKYNVRCEAFSPKSKIDGKLRAMRLTTQFEVKVWNLSKEEVRLLWTELEGHTITFTPASSRPLLTLYLNGQRVVSILPGEQDYAKEFAATLKDLPHARAREAIANRFLIAAVAA